MLLLITWRPFCLLDAQVSRAFIQRCYSGGQLQGEATSILIRLFHYVTLCARKRLCVIAVSGAQHRGARLGCLVCGANVLGTTQARKTVQPASNVLTCPRTPHLGGLRVRKSVS